MTNQPTITSNARAWFAHHWIEPPPLRYAQEDRAMFEATTELLQELQDLQASGVMLRDSGKGHGLMVSAAYREDVGQGSIQIVVHAFGMVEVDFDLFQPFRDVVGFFGHAGEVLANKARNKKTNQQRVAEILRKRGISA